MKKKNLIIQGLVIKEGSTAREAVVDLCEKNLNMTDINLSEVHCINNSQILIRLNTVEDTAEILKNCKKLKGSDVFINRDLPKIVRQRKGILLRFRKKVKKENEKAKILVIADSIKIDQKIFKPNWYGDHQELLQSMDAVYEALGKNYNVLFSKLINESTATIEHMNTQQNNKQQNIKDDNENF